MTQPDAALAPKRPLSLVVTMIVCLVIGWAGIIGGCGTLQYYHSPVTEEPPMVEGVDAAAQQESLELTRAIRAALDRARGVRIPLASADLVLSALLAVACSRALRARPGARSLALQAVVANALLTAVGYALTRPLRAEIVLAVVAHYPRAGLEGAPFSDVDLNSALSTVGWGIARAQLALMLAIYAASVLALTSRAATRFLVASPPQLPDREGDGRA